MGSKDKNRVCPLENAGALDIGIRKLFHNPRKILSPYVKDSMTILDVGCGPGFFTIEMAKLVGQSGKVVAADLQQGMLEKLKAKINNTSLQNTIDLFLCQKNKIGIAQEFDFILIFYMLHEVPDQSEFLKEIKSILKPDGKALIVEPKFHVNQKDFAKSLELMKNIGFDIIDEPKIFFSRSALISKAQS